MAAGVSILVPHFRTEELVRLCLRSIRAYSEPPYEVLVIDNDSGEHASLDYLRALPWIRLIERGPGIDTDPERAHKQALDVGLAEAREPFVLSIHTDTIPLAAGWLAPLRARVEEDPRVGVVGAYKLDPVPLAKRVWKVFEHRLGLASRPRLGTPGNPIYPRSHLALYRRAPLLELGLAFDVDDTAGKGPCLALEAAGWKSVVLASETLRPLVAHLDHGTIVVNPDKGGKPKTLRRARRRMRDLYARANVGAILSDESLDH